jgi:hypothetical protein
MIIVMASFALPVYGKQQGNPPKRKETKKKKYLTNTGKKETHEKWSMLLRYTCRSRHIHLFFSLSFFLASPFEDRGTKVVFA